MLHCGRWQRFLTNETNPERLPVLYVVPLSSRRRRIKDACALVKGLLGLAYFWSGAENAVQLQTYATWILYSVLLDLDHAVAVLDPPLIALSLYRHLSFFTVAHQAGTATDVVAYMPPRPAASAPSSSCARAPRSLPSSTNPP